MCVSRHLFHDFLVFPFQKLHSKIFHSENFHFKNFDLIPLQGELCPWQPACRWGRHILSGTIGHMSCQVPYVTYLVECHMSHVLSGAIFHMPCQLPYVTCLVRCHIWHVMSGTICHLSCQVSQFFLSRKKRMRCTHAQAEASSQVEPSGRKLSWDIFGIRAETETGIYLD